MIIMEVDSTLHAALKHKWLFHNLKLIKCCFSEFVSWSQIQSSPCWCVLGQA